MQENESNLWLNNIQRTGGASPQRTGQVYPSITIPKGKIEAFSQVFDRFVRYSRTPAAVKRDHTLDEMRGLNR